MTAHPAATSAAPGRCGPGPGWGIRRAAGWRGSGPRPASTFTVRGGRITGYDVIADPGRLRQLDLAVLGEGG
jgi:hypothetical protein